MYVYMYVYVYVYVCKVTLALCDFDCISLFTVDSCE
jgi:hypothetical protein